MSLRAQGVSYHVGGQCLIECLDLSLEAGEILMLVGNNGAGKSTVLNLLAGCPVPSEGEITLESQPLAAWSSTELAARRAILTQSPSLAFDFTAAEVVSLGATPYTVRAEELKQRMHEVMQWMDVAQFADRSYFSLSGGERQRVHLARVFLQVCLAPSTSRYLLLDEPLAALDLMHQYALLEQLRRLSLSQSGVGVILVTHDLSVARRYADRVCLLKAGRCYAIGKAVEIVTPANIRAVFGVDAVITKEGTIAAQPYSVT